MPYLAFNLNNGNEFIFELVEERLEFGEGVGGHGWPSCGAVPLLYSPLDGRPANSQDNATRQRGAGVRAGGRAGR